MIEKTHEITYIKNHHKFKAWTWFSIFFGYPVDRVCPCRHIHIPASHQAGGWHAATELPGVLGRIRSGTFSHRILTVMAMATSYNWLYKWNYTFYKWGFVSIYN